MGSSDTESFKGDSPDISRSNGKATTSYDQISLKESLHSSQLSEFGTKHESNIYRLKSNGSELSRIISGIRDDLTQEIYRTETIPDAVLAQELEKVSRLSTRQDEEARCSDSHDDYAGTEGSQKSIVEEVATKSVPPPDQGFAWVIAAICMLSAFATWGSNAAYGVFLAYYIEEDVFEGGTQYDYAMIGGIVFCLAQSLCPFATLVYRIVGLRVVIAIGISLQTLGYILASYATKLWQLYICQGVIVGISFSLVFIPASLILPTWFDKRRALAFGFFVSGAGWGGIVFALSIHKVFDMTGNQHWGLKMAALIALVSAFPCFFLRTRTGGELPWRQRLTKQFLKDNIKLIFNLKVMRSTPVIILTIFFMLAVFGYSIVLYSVSAYAQSVGLTPSQGSTLTAILNAGQVVGRPSVGHIGDRIGRSNFTICCCMILVIFLSAFWINATTFASLVPFSLFIGMILGVGSSMTAPICMELVDSPSEFPAAWSIANILVGLPCLVAELIALHLTQKGVARPYLHTQIFTACVFLGAGLVMLVLRSFLVARAIKRRLDASLQRLEEIDQAKSRYLVVEDLEKEESVREEVELLNDRKVRHERLLQGGIYYFFVRMLYPMKV